MGRAATFAALVGGCGRRAYSEAGLRRRLRKRLRLTLRGAATVLPHATGDSTGGYRRGGRGGVAVPPLARRGWAGEGRAVAEVRRAVPNISPRNER